MIVYEIALVSMIGAGFVKDIILYLMRKDSFDLETISEVQCSCLSRRPPSLWGHSVDTIKSVSRVRIGARAISPGLVRSQNVQTGWVGVACN